jgi:ATP-dependent DNA helicase RecG
MNLNTPLKNILRTTKPYLEGLEKLGVFTLEDLLLFFPRTYEIHHLARTLSDINLQYTNSIELKLLDFQKHTTKSQKHIFKAFFQDRRGQECEAAWFHKPFQMSGYKEGDTLRLIGKAQFEFGSLSFVSPLIASNKTPFQAIVPVYHATEALSSSWISQKVHSILSYRSLLKDPLPEKLREEESLTEKSEAVFILHSPSSQELLEKAKKRMAFEELFFLHVSGLKRKKEAQKNTTTVHYTLDSNRIKDFFATLPFTPTTSQKIALYEILLDFEKPVPAQRLLEGDTGSGKTLVAQASALALADEGFQIAIMAPTEVLAKQHYKNFREVFQNFPLKNGNIPHISFLTGSLKTKEKRETLQRIESGETNMVIGTHALLSEGVNFLNLGLVIIDEQHRFGVEQREKLQSMGNPHCLSMTATPIPRTLALIAYGDQDISVLTEMPQGRKPILTSVIPEEEEATIYAFINDQLEKGRQCFVICPLISESKSEIMAEITSVTQEYERMHTIFPGKIIAPLHGKLKAEEKEDIMTRFHKNEIHILVSTSVIEVGVDNKNASIMMITGAERFGLSQLHQFRGRVGRGEHQSYCFLFPGKEYAKNNERLRALEKHSDGFKLAEIDLQLRGPGEVFGLKQSGIPDLKMASYAHPEFIAYTRKKAEEWGGEEW